MFQQESLLLLFTMISKTLLKKSSSCLIEFRKQKQMLFTHTINKKNTAGFVISAADLMIKLLTWCLINLRTYISQVLKLSGETLLTKLLNTPVRIHISMDLY